MGSRALKRTHLAKAGHGGASDCAHSAELDDLGEQAAHTLAGGNAPHGGRRIKDVVWKVVQRPLPASLRRHPEHNTMITPAKLPPPQTCVSTRNDMD